MKTTSLKSSLCCRLCILLGLFGTLLHIPAAEPPVTPTEPIILFGKDQTKLDRFYTYIEDKKYEDPQRVFTVVDAIDGAPAIRVSGEGAYGGLITKQEYANYRLVGSQWTLPNDGGGTSTVNVPFRLGNTTLETFIQLNASCINCHGFANVVAGKDTIGTDFSFLFGAAK